MASFVATYNSSTGQPRNLTLKAADLVEAKRLLRRRGIKAIELKAADAGKKTSNNDAKEEQQSLLSFDLGRAFEKPPGVKEKAVFAAARSTRGCRSADCAAWI